METPKFLQWAFGPTMDVKEGVQLAAAVIIILTFLSA